MINCVTNTGSGVLASSGDSLSCTRLCAAQKYFEVFEARWTAARGVATVLADGGPKPGVTLDTV